MADNESTSEAPLGAPETAPEPATETPSEEAKAEASPPAFGFGAASGAGFGSAAGGATSIGTGFQFGSFGSTATPAAGAAEADDEPHPEEECKAEFAPVIQLNEVETVTGEEEETTLHEIKAKLYRFDMDKSEWKERGLGVMKLLEHKETKKCRLLMRRDKTLKICCNQYVQAAVDLKEHPGNDKSWVWTAADFSEGEVAHEMLCIRFGSAEKAQAFKDAYVEVQKKLPAVESTGEAVKEEEPAETAETDKLAAELQSASVGEKEAEA